MPQGTRTRILATGPLFFGMIMGCAGGPDRPPTYPVKGTVTFGGKPLADAVVCFRPQDAQNGQRPANGKTDAEGRYRLTTFSSDDGAMAGTYRVTLMKFDTLLSEPSSENDGNYVPPSGPLPDAKNLLPKKFADARTSEMTATVGPNAAQNIFDFALSSDAK